ncbi:MAG: transposase [Deltaproteobacteria bacterium]|nr:transposase [Deltaproteobacteria bacterium]
MLLFIGFNRIWHFTYVRLDAMLCGIFRLTQLPVASTFWRYVDSLGINQANSLLNLMSKLRERVWQQCGLYYFKIRIDVDTTVETLYGNQQGGRKGHNTKNRGKRGYRPILCFIYETREYLIGKLRKGDTVSGKEAAAFVAKIQAHIPGCVQEVLLRADGEFIIGNKGCKPPFDPQTWYRPWKRKNIQYNSCIYTPTGWSRPCRFVAMRIPKEETVPAEKMIQCKLFEDDRYKYRIFCTNIGRKPHEIIDEYDKRADVENLVGEAKREGLDAIPSGKFKNNYAFFQIVIGLKGIMNNTIRIARLKLLYLAAKVVIDSNVDKVKYSVHDTRTPGMLHFLKFLDKARQKARPWEEDWPYRFAVQ